MVSVIGGRSQRARISLTSAMIGSGCGMPCTSAHLPAVGAGFGSWWADDLGGDWGDLPGGDRGGGDAGLAAGKARDDGVGAIGQPAGGELAVNSGGAGPGGRAGPGDRGVRGAGVHEDAALA